MNHSISVRDAVPSDSTVWLELRHAMWPRHSASEHREEIDRYFAGASAEPLAVLLATDSSGRAIGFVELSIRPYAEGCDSRNVAYLEGWFVVPEARRRGVGRVLISAAQVWGRSHGCSEFASDAHPDNELSALAHRGVGFEDVGLVRCFRKSL